MKKINYKSDFDFILRLKDCKDPKKTIPFPECDFEARFWASNKANVYTASHKDGVCTNCFQTEDGGMHFVFDNHRLGVGTLKWEPHFEHPNDIYPENIQDLFSKESLDIELVDGPGDCPTTSEVEIIAPYIKGDKGDKLTYADLTDEDKTDLIQPIKDGIDKAIDEKADRTELSNIIGDPTEEEIENISPTLVTEALRKVPQLLTPDEQEQVKQNIGVSKMELFDDLWHEAVGKYGDVDHSHTEYGVSKPYYLNELWLTYEEAVAIYNEGALTTSSCSFRYSLSNIKTNLPMLVSGGDFGSTAPQLETKYFAFSCNNLEVLNVFNLNEVIERKQNNFCLSSGSLNAFDSVLYRLPKLRKILGRVDLGKAKSDIKKNVFSVPSLVSVRIWNLRNNLDFSILPLLDYDSIKCIVDKAINTSTITITVHQNLYAKLTDETNTEWHQILLDAADKNITFATI